jgi:prepilin-type N-terminal cleavage/methylation domain-containing protein
MNFGSTVNYPLASKPVPWRVGGPTGVRAFTLIELLLATAIFAVVLLAIQTVFFAGLTLRNRATAALDDNLPVHQALAILRKDLQNTVTPGGVLAGHFRMGGPASTTQSGTATVSGTGNASSSVTGGGSTLGSSASGSGNESGGLDFFTSTGVLREYEAGGDIQEVNYRLMEPLEKTEKTWGLDLLRGVTRNLLAYATPQPEEQRLLENVESLEFEFYTGMDWQETWDTTVSGTPLPKAVRVSLLMATDPTKAAVRREPIRMIVVLPDTVSTNSTSSTTTNETSSADSTQ